METMNIFGSDEMKKLGVNISDDSKNKINIIEKLLDKSRDTSDYRSLNTICFNKRIQPLATLALIGNLNSLNISAIAECYNSFGEDITSVAIECAIGCKRGILKESKTNKHFEDLGNEDAGDLAKKVLTEHGVYYKATSVGKNAKFRVSEFRWGHREMPILNSANAIPQNTTTKSILGLDEKFETNVSLAYLECYETQLSTRARNKQLLSFNNFIKKIEKASDLPSIGDKTFLSDLKLKGNSYKGENEAATSFGECDVTIGKINERIATYVFIWYLTENAKYLKPLEKLITQREDNIRIIRES